MDLREKQEGFPKSGFVVKRFEGTLLGFRVAAGGVQDQGERVVAGGVSVVEQKRLASDQLRFGELLPDAEDQAQAGHRRGVAAFAELDGLAEGGFGLRAVILIQFGNTNGIIGLVEVRGNLNSALILLDAR